MIWHWISTTGLRRTRPLPAGSVPAESQALDAIDEKLATMSRDGAEFNAELWTDAALKSSPHWQQLRTLATAALDAFGWAVDAPPANLTRGG